MDGHLSEAGGADGVASSEHVDEVAIQLGQGPSPDPVRITRNGLGAVVPVVVIGLVAKLAGLTRTNQTCRLEPSRRFAR